MNKKDFDHIDKLAKDAFDDFEVDYNAQDWFQMADKLDKEQNIDQVAKNALEDFEVAYNEADWKLLAKELDKQKHLFPYMGRLKGVEAGILALFVFTFFNLSFDETNKSTSIFSINTIDDNTSTLLNNNQNNLTTPNQGNEVYYLNNKTEEKPSDNELKDPQVLNDNNSVANTNQNNNKVLASNSTKTTDNKGAFGGNKKAANSFAKSSKKNKATKGKVIGLDTKGRFDFNKNNTTLVKENDQDENNGLSTSLNKEMTAILKTKDYKTAEYLFSTEKVMAFDAEGNTIKNAIVDPVFELKNVDNAQKYICRIHVGGLASADINLATSMGGTSIGYGAGAFMDIECSSRIFVKTGVLASHKKYFSQSNYQLDRTLVDGNIYNIEEEKTTNLVVLQIPVDVQYIFFKNEKWRVFASAGISANIIGGRIYEGAQTTSTQGLDISTDINSNSLERGAMNGGDVSNNFYLSVGGGLGLERQLGDNMSLYLMPSYKHAVTPSGLQKDFIGTFSINVGVKTTLK